MMTADRCVPVSRSGVQYPVARRGETAHPARCRASSPPALSRRPGLWVYESNQCLNSTSPLPAAEAFLGTAGWLSKRTRS